jgi:flagellar hook-length control protein FliK
MTFTTNNLDAGLLGFDAANTRPRAGRSGGDGSFAEVFEAQVRGNERMPARHGGANEPEAEAAGKTPEANGAAKSKERPARTVEEAGTEEPTGEMAAEAPGATAEAPMAMEGEDAAEPTPEQLLAALNGKELPVGVQEGVATTGASHEVTPEMASEVTPESASELVSEMASEVAPEIASELVSEMASELVSEMASEVAPEIASELVSEMASEMADEHDVFNPLAAATDSNAATEDPRVVQPRRAGARASEAALATGQEAKPSTERPAGDLLAAFRFSRMAAQEQGAGKMVLETTLLGEGKPADPSAPRGTDFLGLLNGLGAAPGRGVAPMATQAPAAPSVPVPLNHAGWDQAFNERVVWMARQGLQEAHIQVTPREMGPIEVRISLQQDQATVNFTAHNVVARDAIEAALPRLRDMLADSGLNLVQSEVSQQSPQERGDGREHLDGRSGTRRDAAELDGADIGIGMEVSHTEGGRGMVDFFA